MAEVAEPSTSFLTKKAGPLPVWAWGLLGLGVAYGYSRYRADKSTSSTTSSDTTDQTDSTSVPDFISQNYIYNQPAPPTPVATPAPPTTTPTTPTSPAPPTTTPTTPSKPTTPPKTTTPAPKAPIQYKVKSGDTLSAIAKKYGTTWQALWTFNTTPGNRPAATIATLKKRGANTLYSGETILIPQK